MWLFQVATEQHFTCKLEGENAPTRTNRTPTPVISDKWTDRLFFVILWPLDVVAGKSLQLLPTDVIF